MAAYRICKGRYVDSIWSGQGAKLEGGRWNSPGVALVYAAENRSLAILEQLVHRLPPRLLDDFLIAAAVFDDSLIQQVDRSKLGDGWDDPVAPEQLQSIGNRWVQTAMSVVLAVPSAVTRGEWNYLINPAHPRFGEVERSVPQAFPLDPRLR